MDLSGLGKYLIIFGVGLAALGVILWLVGKVGLPFGNLPGDIHVERTGFSFNFPVVTCIVLSIVITVVANLVFWFLRK